MASEDVVQNIFLKFYEQIHLIRNPESVKYWLFKAARNEIYSHFRKKKIHVDRYNVEDVNEIEIPHDQSVVHQFEFDEMKQIIMNELNSIQPELREPFIMKEFGGLSYKEISKILEIDENLVKSRLYNVRQKLIKNLSAKIK